MAVSVVLTRALPIALGAAILFWAIRWLAFGRPTVRTPGDWPIGLLVLMIPVTLWATALPDVTRVQVYRLSVGIALYYAVANWARAFGRLRLVAMGLIVVGLGLAAAAPVSVKWVSGAKLSFIPSSLYKHFPLLIPDPVHPNVMAGVLVVLLPLAFALIFLSWGRLHWYEQALTPTAFLFMLAILVLTKSRGGYMGAAAGLWVVLLLRWPRVALGILVLTGGGAGYALHHCGTSVVINALSATSSLNNIAGRLEVWSRAWYMVQDFPFTGIGMGTFQKVANLLYPFFLAGPDAKIPHAHDIFLQVAVDLGIPGLIAWLSLLLLVFLAAWSVYRYGRDNGDWWMAGLGAGLIGSQVALIVHGLVDAVTWGTRPAVVVWALWGISMAAYHLVVRQGLGAGRFSHKPPA